MTASYTIEEQQIIAREAGALGEHFTELEFQALCSELDNECSYCSRGIQEVGPLVADHMIPLSRGGGDCISNITPACSYCNAIKRDKTVDEFLDYLDKLVVQYKG